MMWFAVVVLLLLLLLLGTTACRLADEIARYRFLVG